MERRPRAWTVDAGQHAESERQKECEWREPCVAVGQQHAARHVIDQRLHERARACEPAEQGDHKAEHGESGDRPYDAGVPTPAGDVHTEERKKGDHERQDDNGE